MSIWRDIWKEAVSANQKMVLEEDSSAKAFSLLLEKYPNDGMVFYEMGEAYETMGDYDKATENYKKARELFPVPHWKNVAKFAMDRIEASPLHFDSVGYDKFYTLQWNAFHTMHTFAHLLDECRYLGISALSRIDSEAGSEIVHFRTAMEIEIRALFPDLIPNPNDLCLGKILSKLKIAGVDWEVICDMDNVRLKGNDSVQENTYDEKYLSSTINSFIAVMEYFDSISQR